MYRPCALPAANCHALTYVRHRPALIPFICAGDPGLDVTAKALRALDDVRAPSLWLGHSADTVLEETALTSLTRLARLHRRAPISSSWACRTRTHWLMAP